MHEGIETGYKDRKQKAKNTIKQLRKLKIRTKAKGTREVEAIRETGDRLKSTSLALMAASGGAPSTEIMADIEDRTQFNELSAMFDTDQQLDDLTEQIRDNQKMTRRSTKEKISKAMLPGSGVKGLN